MGAAGGAARAVRADGHITAATAAAAADPVGNQRAIENAMAAATVSSEKDNHVKLSKEECEELRCCAAASLKLARCCGGRPKCES